MKSQVCLSEGIKGCIELLSACGVCVCVQTARSLLNPWFCSWGPGASESPPWSTTYWVFTTHNRNSTQVKWCSSVCVWQTLTHTHHTSAWCFKRIKTSNLLESFLEFTPYFICGIISTAVTSQLLSGKKRTKSKITSKMFPSLTFISGCKGTLFRCDEPLLWTNMVFFKNCSLCCILVIAAILSLCFLLHD